MAFLDQEKSSGFWVCTFCATIYDVLRNFLGTNKLASDIVARSNLQLFGWRFVTWWACWFQALPHVFIKLSRVGFWHRDWFGVVLKRKYVFLCPMFYRIHQLDLIWIKWDLQQRGETHDCSRACFESSRGLLYMFWMSWHVFFSCCWLISHSTFCWTPVFNACLRVVYLFASLP